jgi:hypothetical protein
VDNLAVLKVKSLLFLKAIQTSNSAGMENFIVSARKYRPATFDTVIMPEWLQVHHLEQDFYDTYGLGGLVNETHRKHMERWHK